MAPANEQLDALLRAYAAGDISAADAAYELQALVLPGFENPSASEIIVWSKDAGHGIPTPTEAELRAQVARLLAGAGMREKLN